MKKRFTSFEDVDKELEILKLEREIQMRKMGLRVENISDAISPSNLIKTGFSTFATSFKESSGLRSIIFTAVIRFIIKQIKTRKSR